MRAHLEQLESLGLQSLRREGCEGRREGLLGVSEERMSPGERGRVTVLLHHLLDELLELRAGPRVSSCRMFIIFFAVR